MYKKVLSVQDISCVGQCSTTVALPIISACAIETSILPSSVLSTHTAGFKNFTFCDLTGEFAKIINHWKSENISFDSVYTGYLGNTKQVEYVIEIKKCFLKKDGLMIVDPAMADNGRLYPGFDGEYVEAMKRLCKAADIILPNITEACLLTDTEYSEKHDMKFAEELIEKLHTLFDCKVVLTGANPSEDKIAVGIYENGEISFYTHRKIEKSFHGTGDVYSSAFVGAYLNGKSVFEAAGIAADYTVSCIENTIDDSEHWYGVKFEPLLPELINAIK